jgi:hypothetical protein
MFQSVPGAVFFRWGDGDIPQKDGQQAVFDRFDIYKNAGNGFIKIFETCAYCYLDTAVLPGHFYTYNVYGVELDYDTGQIKHTVFITHHSATVPYKGPKPPPSKSVLSGSPYFDPSKRIPAPIEYQLTAKSKKLRHAWKATLTKDDGLFGTIIEDDTTGHAVAFIPATNACSYYWDQPTTVRGCYRLRNLDKDLNLSEPTEWICNSPSLVSICEGGTIGNQCNLVSSIVYSKVTIGDYFCDAAVPAGQLEVVGWGASIGDHVTLNKAVTLGDLAQIADSQTLADSTVVTYNGKVPE